MSKVKCPDCGGQGEIVVKYVKQWNDEAKVWQLEDIAFEEYAFCHECDWEGDEDDFVEEGEQ